MRHKYIVGICLLSCFLLSSTAFISSVQANEVKKAVEEKQESVMNSILSKVPKLSAIDSLDIINILIIIWIICYFTSAYLIFFLLLDLKYFDPITILDFIISILGAFPLAFVLEAYFFFKLITEPFNTISWVMEIISDLIFDFTDFIGSLFKFIIQLFISLISLVIFILQLIYSVIYWNIVFIIEEIKDLIEWILEKINIPMDKTNGLNSN